MKRITIKFKSPKAWDDMQKLSFVKRVVYITKSGSDDIHGITCQEADEVKVRSFLKKAHIF